MNSDDDEVEFLGTTNTVVNSKHTAKTKVINNSNDIIGLAEYRAEASLKYQQQKEKSNNDNRTNKDNVIDVDAIRFQQQQGIIRQSTTCAIWHSWIITQQTCISSYYYKQYQCKETFIQ